MPQVSGNTLVVAIQAVAVQMADMERALLEPRRDRSTRHLVVRGARRPEYTALSPDRWTAGPSSGAPGRGCANGKVDP